MKSETLEGSYWRRFVRTSERTNADVTQWRTISTNERPETHLDITGTGFWTPGQRIFLDVRVFDLNAQRHNNLELQKCCKRNDDEKKRRMYIELSLIHI